VDTPTSKLGNYYMINTGGVMSETRFIEHKGKRILLMDFSNTKDKEQVMQTVADIKALVQKEPLDSVYGLVDITGSPFDADIAQALKELARDNKPYMKVSVSTGVTGIRLVIFRAIIMFSGRKNLILKDTREEAMDWLAEQK
jgi:hypothetical protein